MKKLNVRFGDTQELRLKDTSEVLNLDVSKVARAAMLLGINQLLALASRDVDKAVDLALINELRARQ
jgi:hypothetical protein|tara:strand:- start:140 stop:340 length:201 start_codon:yes stop_codon:yes gene_type:complete